MNPQITEPADPKPFIGTFIDKVLVLLSHPAWTGAGAIVGSISLGFTIYEHVTKRDKKQATRIIKDLTTIIQASQDKIISDIKQYIDDVRFTEVTGKYFGLLEVLSTYDRCPEEDIRILGIVDNSGYLLGELETMVGNTDVEKILKVWPFYISVVAIRQYAMAEYSLYYKGHDLNDIWELMLDASETADSLIKKIREDNSADFGPVIETHDIPVEPGNYSLGYTYGGKTFSSEFVRGSPINPYSQVQRMRQNHIERVFNQLMQQPEIKSIYQLTVSIYIRKAYFRVLEREHDEDGMKTYSEKFLNDGWSVRTLIKVLATSPEHRTRFVDNNSPERICDILADHLLAKNNGSEWVQEYKQNGLEILVNKIINSKDYIDNFGDFGVPGDGRTGKWSILTEQLPEDISKSGTKCEL